MQKDRQTEPNPNYVAQICPVCNGFGTLSYGKKKCHACNGRGFVVINNETGMPVEDREKNEKELS